MKQPPAFTGFPKEGIEFLQELALNNEREWFKARKQDYTDTVLAPAQGFVASLGARLQEVMPGIEFDLKTSGGGSILRIYRDVRFSKNKAPYNTNVRMVFWEGGLKRMENPGFFIVVNPSGAGIYAGQHQFSKSLLKAYRQAVIDEELGAQLEEAIAAVRSAGDYQIGGLYYKKVPRGFWAYHERAELLKYAGLYASTSAIGPELLHQPELVEVCFDHCHSMAPIHRWLVGLTAG